MVCFAQRFSHVLAREKHDGVEPRKVRIYFYEDKIYYWFNKVMHRYTHVPTMKYIYHLMSLMDNVYWMKGVLKKVYTKKSNRCNTCA